MTGTVKLGDARPYRPIDLAHPPVRVETMLLSIVEPAPGQAVAYNDWYERDHQFDGGMSGEGWFSNRRWVATRRLKALRFPADGAFSDIGIGSLCQVYWRRQGHAASSEQWALDQWVRLDEQHRIFSDRTHFHSASYRHLSTACRTGERVSLELALQHPFAGLVMLVVDDGGAGEARTAAIAALEAVACDGLLGEDIALLASWELLRPPGQPVSRPPGTAITGEHDRLVQLAFLRDDPERVWPRIHAYADAVAARSTLRLSFAAPFIPTVPGTTAHLDDL